MDWDKAYENLKNVMYEGKRLNSNGFIKKIKGLNEWHREMYINYFDSFIQDDKLSAIHTYKYPIQNFLLQDNINIKQFSDISQIDIDNFLEQYLNKKINYYNTIQYAIKNYFEFYAEYMNFTPEYIKFPVEDDATNKKLPLTCEELEDIRNIIGQSYFLQFIFELAYENGIRFEQSRYYSKKTYDDINGRFIKPDGEYIVLSKKLQTIVEKIKDTDEFNDPYYKQGFSKSKLYRLLQDNGFNRAIKSKDVNTAFEENTSFKCPGCGGRYEATASNWIIKQYYDDGELWIVCKEKCGKKNENI